MKPPSWSSLSSLLLLTLPTGSIAGIIINRGTEDTQDQPQTCRPEISPFDYSAKLRSVYELPVCSAGDETGGIHGRNDGGSNDVSFLAAESLSFLTGRQVVGLNDDYTCAPDRPCKNKACCPKATLQCNYGPEACGTSGITPNEVCWHNCDAKAECGQFADPPGKKCPLNVCCGKWGFCGMTKDFCDVEDHGATGGCQSNCAQPGPKKKDSEQLDRVIGYYEAWRYKSQCQGMGLDDIPVNSLTHLFFSFGFITPGDFNIVPMDNLPFELFRNFTNLKKKNPGLKVMIAVGGWTHNDEGPLQKVFTNLASTQQNRQKFITNLLSLMRRYGFDGVDFDWEYPGADDRGGEPEDGVNFTLLLKELQEAIKKQPMKYIVSFTAPTSYWYLRHFDLKAVDYVDFVNVMSYDLHGVWDAKNPIGSHVYGHTNLTEMKMAFDLFWRNDVPASKLNMGFGFYGRAYTLADPACNKPGCVFKGGATAGACSGESGILTYREIMEVIRNKKIKPIHDKAAGVKYITWNVDQWVSYDDKETFKQKKDFAKELGLGGFLIWAIDQDDDQLAALQAVLDPQPLKAFAMTKGDENWTGSNEMCYVTECDGKCKSGYIKITDQKCAKNKKSQLCCPLSGAPDPKECHWRGDPLMCNGRCHDDEVMTHMSKFGSGGTACTDGQKAHCCKSPLAEENTCFWKGVGQQCPAGYEMMTFSGTAFDLLDDIAAVIIQVVGSFHPLTRLTGRLLAQVIERIDIRTKKLFCCKTNDIEKWDNCDWYGKPGNCFDGHCPDMRFVQLTDSYFGGDSTCGRFLNRRRVFCCQPKNGQPLFLPVPLENLFPNPPQGDSVDTEFELKTDKESAGGNTDPNDAAFQFYILASPEAIQQSLDKRDGSHWEVFDCKDAVTEGEHKVKMVCTDTSENSNCYKIGLGHGVPGTILQMPRGCGPGKYAVAKSLEPLPVEDHRKILPRHLAHLADSKPVVYELTFDYDFSRVPRDLGDTKLRVDFSNQDDYWNTIVAGAASKKKRGLSKRTLADVGGNHVRWLEEEFRDDYHFGGLDKRELHERWFGSSVIEWLVQLLKPEIKREFHYKYEDSITAKILDESWQCKNGDVGYEGHLLAQALLNVNVETSFGFTLIVESLRAPLDISQSYLTFYNKGEITGILTLEAVAKILYEKKGVIANIPFPGATFRIPGIATIGPQITVEGGIDALFAVGGIVETKLEIAKWEVRHVVPDNNDETYKPKEIAPGDPKLDRTGSFEGLKRPSFFAGVAVHGDVTAKLSAAAEFGIRFDDKWKIKPAAAAVVGETSVMLKMAAGASTEGVCPFTYGVDVGARLYARVTAPQAFHWSGIEYDLTPKWNKAIIQGGTCPELAGIPMKRDLDFVDGSANHSVTALAQRSPNSLAKRSLVFGPAFRLPVGSFFCPIDDGEELSCSDHDKIWADEPDPEAVWKRSLNTALFDKGHGDVANVTADVPDHLDKRTNAKSVKICDNDETTFQYPTGGELGANVDSFGWVEPDNCTDYKWGGPLAARVAGIQYDSEHVLEAQLVNDFFKKHMAGVHPQVPHPNPAMIDSAGNRRRIDWCDYVRLMIRIPAFVIPNLDTSEGTNVALTPLRHIAAQFPTNNWKEDEYIALQSYINSVIKNHAWAGGRIVNTDKWATDYTQPAVARKMIVKMRGIIGLRLYHNNPTVMSILRAQKNRIGTILNLLDTQYLPNNRPAPGWDAWPGLNLQSEWNRFMSGRFRHLRAKCDSIVEDHLDLLLDYWATPAMKQASQNNAGNKAIIRDIEEMDIYWMNEIPDWEVPF